MAGALRSTGDRCYPAPAWASDKGGGDRASESRKLLVGFRLNRLWRCRQHQIGSIVCLGCLTAPLKCVKGNYIHSGGIILPEEIMPDGFSLKEAAAIAELPEASVRTAIEKKVI